MGQKTHPIGFRLGIIKDWQAKWYAAKGSQYRELLQEDLSIRNAIRARLPEAGISKVELERGAQELVVTIHSARPGIVIGRGGQRVEEVRQVVEGLTHKRARLNVQEVRQPELDAQLVAASIAEQLGRRVAFRRAMHQAVNRAMQSGALGMKVICSGRLGGVEIARREKVMQGRVPLHTLRADIDYGLAEARTTMGRIGVKVWVYKGDILPEPKVIEAEPDAEELQMIEVTVGGETESIEGPSDVSTQEN
jgi:small subunit ribosomal protein S3